MLVLLLQVAGLVALLALFSFAEQTAAMRGTRGQESLPTWVQRLVRVLFLALLVGPICAAVPYSLLLVLLYLPAYLDLSELYCGRPSRLLKQLSVFNLLKWYFGLQLVKTAELDPKQHYLIALEPHGILPFGGVANMALSFDKVFPGISLRGVAASFCFYIPGYRDFILGIGICDASRYSADRILQAGKSLYLVPGGATEALYASSATDFVYLKNRKGFVRLALKHGAHIVPVFSFNESNTYDQFSIDNATVMYIKRKFQAIFGLSLPLVKHVLPRSVPIVTVVGKPIVVPQIDNADEEVVQEYLDKYISALSNLYDAHKSEYNIVKTKELVVL